MPEELLKNIYEYWITRRNEFGRPLIPYVLGLQTETKSPYTAFLPRNIKTKKSKHNTALIYAQLWQLRQEMEKARTLVEMIRKREKLKLDHVLLMSKTFDINTGKITEEDLPLTPAIVEATEPEMLLVIDQASEISSPAPDSPVKAQAEGEEKSEEREIEDNSSVEVVPVESPALSRKTNQRKRPKQDTERSLHAKKGASKPSMRRKRTRDIFLKDAEPKLSLSNKKLRGTSPDKVNQN